MNRKGFTLVELLVAASLFLVATSAFGYLLKTGLVSIETASRLNQAAYELQAKMEEIRPLPFNQLAALNGSAFAQDRGEVSVTPVLADLVRIKLELEWDPKKTSLKLYTLRSKY
ncbi:MAG: prepilin-type N-terminal cleavage/methylation domain-containing protein [Candidatus Margulisiibacteriota bacterium]